MLALGSALVAQGLAGAPEDELLTGFCRALDAAGLPLARALLIVDTLHPIHEGRAFRWRKDEAEEAEMFTYGRTNLGDEAEASWRRSPFYHLVVTGEDELRCRLEPGELPFAILETLRAEGASDYLAMIHRFADGRAIGELDCIYSHWTTGAPGGFSTADLAVLRRLVPILALAVKSAALATVANTLAEVYLGRDAGRRVLEGRIARGITERIGAVLWFSDLRGFTAITDAAPPEAVIPLLNDYAEAVITAVHEAGGDVLKLIGDGTLAIFERANHADATAAALAAERDLRRRLATVNARRQAAGQPVTTVYLGLHVGDVFYGNVGSDERLDFTVVGPAVNEVSRIAAMCRAVDREVVVSAEFADAAPPDEQDRLVAVGRFALRGVGRAQMLYTIDPALRSPAAG